MIKIILIALLYTLSYSSNIQRVIDGDTVVLRDNTKVRLLYIDTPEKVPSQKLNKDISRTGITKDIMKSMGVKSKEFLEDMLRDKTVSTNISKLDIYGRSLAVLQVGEETINLQMVSSGYACVYRKAKYPERYLEAEGSAKTKRVGLWSTNYTEMSTLCKP